MSTASSFDIWFHTDSLSKFLCDKIRYNKIFNIYIHFFRFL